MANPSASLGTARIDVEVNTDEMVAGANRAKATLQDMARSGGTAYDALDAKEKRRVESLRRQVDTLGLTREAQLAYDISMRTSGKVQDDLLAKLQRNTVELRKGSGGLNEYGLSAKQTAAALRGVPAQLTDIAVSLQGGQRPLTVLLQQGGQLKDMFGGIVPAAKALGGAVLGLVNPYTILAGVVVGVSTALYKGAQEEKNYSAALINTGNVAGTTADNLADLSRQIDETSGATQRAASEAVTAATNAGFRTSEQIETVARAALAMEEATGKAISDTVDEFKKLQDEPVKAIIKLNESQHFLTAEVYESIKALQEQGDTVGAASLAIQEYARVVEDRASKIQENLGFIERSWVGIKFATNEAIDAALNWGRESTRREQFDELFSQLQRTKTELAELDISSPQRGRLEKRIAEIRSELEQLGGAAIDIQKQAARDQAGARAADSYIQFDKELMEMRSRGEKLKAERIRVNKEVDEAVAQARLSGNVELAEKIEVQRAQLIEGIEKKYAERKKKQRKETDPGDSVISRLRDQIALNEEAVKSEDKLTASERLAIRTKNDVAEAGNKMSAASRALIPVLLEELKRTDDLAVAQAKAAKLRETLARLDTQLAAEALQRQRESNVALLAMQNSDAEAERIQRRLKIEQDYIDELARLRDKGVAETSEEYIAQEERLRKHRDNMLLIERDFQSDREALQGDFSTGYQKALAEMEESSRNFAKVGEDISGAFFGALGDAAADFAIKGKASLDDFREYAIRTAVQLLTNKAITWLLRAFGGGSVGGVEREQIPIMTNAKGNVYDGAGLSKYSGKVYNSPQVFAFARGAGVFAEAGPEAIMPLTRTASGRLGVETVGGNGGGDVKVEVINNTGTAAEATATQQEGADGSRLIKIVLSAVADDISSGGMVNKSMKGTFGLRENA